MPGAGRNAGLVKGMDLLVTGQVHSKLAHPCEPAQPVISLCLHSRVSLSPSGVPNYMSLAILTFFMTEIFFKILVFRLEFFHQV